MKFQVSGIDCVENVDVSGGKARDDQITTVTLSVTAATSIPPVVVKLVAYLRHGTSPDNLTIRR